MATDANSQISTNYSVGIHNVGSYQVAGTAWITGSFLVADANSGSTATYVFPMVAKSVTVKVIPPGYYMASGLANVTASTAVHVCFGELRDGPGSLIQGNNSFNTVGQWAISLADYQIPPQPILNRHYYSLQHVSASNPATPEIQYGQEMTFNVKTTHVNIAVFSPGHGVTGSYQIYAELTNIPTARMWEPSGSGINTVP